MKKKTDIKTRILKRIKIDDNGCWLLPPSKKNNGYSKMRINGVNKRAHKVSWEVFVGPVPKGLLVLHHCDVRHCVNPAHLWLGTPKDNYEDMVRKGRCKSTHPPVYKGQENPLAKLTNAQAQEIRTLYSTNKYTQQNLALIYKVSSMTISNIVRNKVYTVS